MLLFFYHILIVWFSTSWFQRDKMTLIFRINLSRSCYEASTNPMSIDGREHVRFGSYHRRGHDPPDGP